MGTLTFLSYKSPVRALVVLEYGNHSGGSLNVISKSRLSRLTVYISCEMTELALKLLTAPYFEREKNPCLRHFI